MLDLTTEATPGIAPKTPILIAPDHVPAPELPKDGQRYTCPVTKLDTLVHGLIVEREPGHNNHWWGCWSCAGLYWKADMPVPVQKSWHCVRVAITPEPTPADWIEHLILEYEHQQADIAALAPNLPADPDYDADINELLAQCRAVVQTMREREGRLLPRVITIHP